MRNRDEDRKKHEERDCEELRENCYEGVLLEHKRKICIKLMVNFIKWPTMRHLFLFQLRLI